jgi:SsrA-binding protein
VTKKKDAVDAVKLIAKNRKAWHDFEVVEKIEAGLVLQGTEVKSLRAGQVSFTDSYARMKKDEVWLVELHIAPYMAGSINNHEPKRPRKLLLHKREIAKLRVKMETDNMTLVPLEIYFRRGFAKVELGVCKGKKLHDKREALKKKSDRRDMDRFSKRGRDR